MTQRNWFITDVTSGPGRLLAEKLLQRGDRVGGTTRRPEELASLTKTYDKDRLWLAKLELTNPEEYRRAVDDAFERIGHLDVLISNAGYRLLGAAEEISDEQLRRQIDSNLLASMRVIWAALPTCADRETAVFSRCLPLAVKALTRCSAFITQQSGESRRTTLRTAGSLTSEKVLPSTAITAFRASR